MRTYAMHFYSGFEMRLAEYDFSNIGCLYIIINIQANGIGQTVI